uniref:Uncharacterized protein n=1 Tax=Noctiluca scintillans TaxID=2966 RepID=A0A7S1FE15_NOCSC
MVTGIFLETPDCCSSKDEWVLCCCQLDTACCKPVIGDAWDHKQYLCHDSSSYCVTPTTCCQWQSQKCCIDFRCALPCSDKVPCILTALPFCICCADWEGKVACCKKGADVIPRITSTEGLTSRAVKAELIGAPIPAEMG